MRLYNSSSSPLLVEGDLLTCSNALLLDAADGVRCPVTVRDLKSGDNTEPSFMMVQIPGTMLSLSV